MSLYSDIFFIFFLMRFCGCNFVFCIKKYISTIYIKCQYNGLNDIPFFFCFKTKAKEDNALSSSVPSARKTYGLILFYSTLRPSVLYGANKITCLQHVRCKDLFFLHHQHQTCSMHVILITPYKRQRKME